MKKKKKVRFIQLREKRSWMRGMEGSVVLALLTDVEANFRIGTHVERLRLASLSLSLSLSLPLSSTSSASKWDIFILFNDNNCITAHALHIVNGNTHHYSPLFLSSTLKPKTWKTTRTRKRTWKGKSRRVQHERERSYMIKRKIQDRKKKNQNGKQQHGGRKGERRKEKGRVYWENGCCVAVGDDVDVRFFRQVNSSMKLFIYPDLFWHIIWYNLVMLFRFLFISIIRPNKKFSFVRSYLWKCP